MNKSSYLLSTLPSESLIALGSISPGRCIHLEAGRVFLSVKSDHDWQLSGVVFLALHRKLLKYCRVDHLDVHFKSQLFSYQASDYIGEIDQVDTLLNQSWCRFLKIDGLFGRSPISSIMTPGSILNSLQLFHHDQLLTPRNIRLLELFPDDSNDAYYGVSYIKQTSRQ
jgi:hypothetical protein